MAITAVRLDGQNIGFRTTGADAVSVISLNISTGALASAYATEEDLRALAPAVSELFALVPSASRAANALGMLQKLAVVSSSGSATVALTATNVGSVYTLVATPSGASFLVAHLPFSAGEGLGWASSGGGSSLAVPVSLADGGTSTDLSASAASRGAFFYNGAAGSTGFIPVPVVVNPISTNPSPASTPKANPITINAEVKNGNVYFDIPAGVLMQGQIIKAGGAVALTDITLAATVGQIMPMADFDTSGQFILITAGNASPDAGKATFTVQTDKVTAGGVAGSLFLLLGSGPGADVLAGARTQLQFT